MPIVRAKMIEFVNSGGITIAGSKGLYIKNAPIVIQPSKPTTIFDEDAQFQSLTPKERMQKKKELETQRKIEEANRAAKDAASNYQRA